jgi:hypothetical protein
MTDINEATASVIIIAERLLSAEKDKTAALISSRVDMAAGIVAVSTAEPIDKPAAVAELIRRYSQWIGKDTTLSDETGHKAWLSATKKKDWRYWARYRDLLGTKMSEIAVDGVDESTDRIIGLLEDPLRPDTWDRRGLVVGHVQSGKTANYTGLICKAADAGYKIIIILAGMHNKYGLRKAFLATKPRRLATWSNTLALERTDGIRTSSRTARPIAQTGATSIPGSPDTSRSRPSRGPGSSSSRKTRLSWRGF